jgi:phage terminase large subunit GpA-like protein
MAASRLKSRERGMSTSREDPAVGSRPIDDEFFAQMTRERLVARRQGYTEWEKPKAAHEAGVCLVYAYAAVAGLQAMSGRYVAMGKAPDPGGRANAG